MSADSSPIPVDPFYVAVIGPTASGKSALALSLAAALDGELVNCDSVQLYRGFEIGAAQPVAAELKAVPHHLWSVAEWHEAYDARLYAERARGTLQEIDSRGRLPILVGGTGLYLRALWRENWHELPKSESLRAELAPLATDEIHARLLRRDPQRAAALHPNDRFRLLRALEISLLLGHPVHQLPPEKGQRSRVFVISLSVPRATLHSRIEARTRTMLEGGLIEEVEGLLARGVAPDAKPMQSIGYAEVVAYLQGRLTRDNLEEAIVIATRQYAKRQETWFRKTEPDAIWTQESDLAELSATIKSVREADRKAQRKRPSDEV